MISVGFSSPSCSTVSVTGVPGLPRSRPTASRSDIPWVLSSPIRRILSPARMPALYAGRACQGTEDHQLLGLGVEGHLHPHALELKIDALLELLQVGRSNIGRVFVELVEHAVHGPLEQLRRLDRLDISVLDGGHGVGQHVAVGVLLHPLVAEQGHQRHGHQYEQIAARHGRVKESTMDDRFGGAVCVNAPGPRSPGGATSLPRDRSPGAFIPVPLFYPRLATHGKCHRGTSRLDQVRLVVEIQQHRLVEDKVLRESPAVAAGQLEVLVAELLDPPGLGLLLLGHLGVDPLAVAAEERAIADVADVLLGRLGLVARRPRRNSTRPPARPAANSASELAGMAAAGTWRPAGTSLSSPAARTRPPPTTDPRPPAAGRRGPCCPPCRGC